MSTMNIKLIKCILFYFLVAFIAYLLIIWIYKKSKNMNGFSNYNLNEPGLYPASDTVPLLTDEYKYSGRKNVSNDSYNDIWWHYPIFREGSYKQITNNLRYYRNPDEGTCIRADFCGALYKDKKNKSNYIYPLPPVPPGASPRVNYYRTNVNLLL